MIVRELLTAFGVKVDTGNVHKFDRAVGRAKTTMAAGSQAAGRLAGALKAAVAGYLGFQVVEGVGRGLISANTEFERLHASLQTIEGSVQGADKAFERIGHFAATTPFQLNQVTEGFVKLRNMGLKSTDEAMQSYGNTASSMGKDLNQMVEAVADAATGEFERLKEFGIKAKSEGNKVKFTFQGVTTTVGKNSAEIEDYLIGIGNNQFAGAMERQMDTLGGRFSNLKDSLFQLAIAVGKAGLNDAIRDVTAMLIEAVQSSNGLAKTIGGALGSGVRGLASGLKAVAQVVQLLGAKGAVVFDVVKAVWASLAPVMPKVLDLVKAVSGALAGLVGDVVSGLVPLLRTAVEQLGPPLLSIVQVVGELLGNLLPQLLPPVLAVLEAVLPLLTQIGTILQQLVAGAAPLIEQLVAKLAPVIEQVVQSLAAGLMPLLEAIGQVLIEVLPIAGEILLMTADLLAMILPLLAELAGDVLVELAGILVEMLPLIKLIFQIFKVNMAIVMPILKALFKVLGLGVKVTVKLFGGMSRIIMRAFSAIADAVGPIGEWLKEVWQDVADFVKGLWDPVASAIERVFEGFAMLWEPIKKSAQVVMEAIMGYIQPVIDGLDYVGNKGRDLAEFLGIGGANFQVVAAQAANPLYAAAGVAKPRSDDAELRRAFSVTNQQHITVNATSNDPAAIAKATGDAVNEANDGLGKASRRAF